uniref:Uncharacterized protein n=1 Tax=Triticum urartu TaxID=4572 RepID=A0A8R7PAN8_TRIUA
MKATQHYVELTINCCCGRARIIWCIVAREKQDEASPRRRRKKNAINEVMVIRTVVRVLFCRYRYLSMLLKQMMFATCEIAR